MAIELNGVEYKIVSYSVDNVAKVATFTVRPVQNTGSGDPVRAAEAARNTYMLSMPAADAGFSLTEAYNYIKSLPQFQSAIDT